MNTKENKVKVSYAGYGAPLTEEEEKIDLEVECLANILIDAFLDRKNMSGRYRNNDDKFSSSLFVEKRFGKLTP